ncbi:MAG: TIGR03936 family radical SAM-associated protein [Candidatus Omnitrophota bacterium]|nr:TIGR03936 family radical SAM-associated protein [Candidatus Omnitrophota bacterium]
MKLELNFEKKGDARFMSHLDLVRLFQRASRRANLPVEITKGFSPHLKISIAKALKLGVEADREEVVFYMEKAIHPADFIKSINVKLPEGVKVKLREETV